MKTCDPIYCGYWTTTRQILEAVGWKCVEIFHGTATMVRP